MDAPHSFSSAYAGSVGSIFGETVTVSFFGDGDRARAQPPDPQAQEVCARHDGASCTDLKIFYTKSADCGCTANLEYFAILKGAGGGLVSAVLLGICYL